MEFKNNLKKQRENKGYTQELLAEKLNVARQTVSKWETGVCEPDIETLKEICVVLNCKISDLINDDITNEHIASKNNAAKIIDNITYFLSIIMFFSIIALVMFAPNNVVVHIYLDGTKTYGSKWFLLLISLFSILSFSLPFISKKIVKKTPFREYRLPYSIVGLLVAVILTALTWILIPLCCTYSANDWLNIFASCMLAFMIALSPFTHPKFNRYNPFFGYKTSFALASEENFNKLNSFGAISMMSFCVISYILSLIFPLNHLSAIWILVGVLGLVPVIIYEIVLKKKQR